MSLVAGMWNFKLARDRPVWSVGQIPLHLARLWSSEIAVDQQQVAEPKAQPAVGL